MLFEVVDMIRDLCQLKDTTPGGKRIFRLEIKVVGGQLHIPEMPRRGMVVSYMSSTVR